MGHEIILNDRSFNAETLHIETISPKGKSLHMVKFRFKVMSEEYHEITTLLYTNDFRVSIPEENIAFQGTIHNYSTSITNLYEEGAVGDFYLELIEKQ
ncbi:DUF3219 family protein [Salinibacillus xinjiangensis]|uniref:DUF3219 family protein n=1 Tax=Salinibacillus xinjiangensis TaxID=1229268 RepID=A0A6G1X5L9_9BACI|nr:DUF3219 family protein [Salinibacillus xinjiangensis]MRG86118.1 DUF3219 family protein [Salinibacillus xinjiangensis]